MVQTSLMPMLNCSARTGYFVLAQPRENLTFCYITNWLLYPAPRFLASLIGMQACFFSTCCDHELSIINWNVYWLIPCCPPPHDVITRTKLAISFIQSVKVPIQLFREPHWYNVSRNVSRPIDRFFRLYLLGQGVSQKGLNSWLLSIVCYIF